MQTFKYQWWGKGDIDASIGVFFDGFAKIFTAVGIMLFAFGMPSEIVIGKILPAIGLVTCLGNLWYFYEAKVLAHKEKRSNVTAQPFGVGGSVVMSWLFLIMGPVYWATGDGMLAFRVGLAAGFIGGCIEVLGAYIGRWLIKVIPKEALMGNLAAGAFIWLGVAGVVLVFNKPEVAAVPLFIIIMDYVVKTDRLFKKLPVGLIAIILGTIIGWTTGYMSIESLVGSFENIGFYMPSLFIEDIIQGLGEVVPYLPIIIPVQIANFLTTLQGVESAKEAGDCYPERQSMLMDGIFTILGSLMGNPFPTTVYYGHPSWKAIDARGGYSLILAVVYSIIGVTGLTGVMMNIIPYEAVLSLLVFVGLSVPIGTLQQTDKKYFAVMLISIIPILCEYIRGMINGAVQAANMTIQQIDPAVFMEFNVPIQGLTILGSGAFLSSLLWATWLAYVINKQYKQGTCVACVLAFSSAIGLIHSEAMVLFQKQGMILAGVYILLGVLTYQKECEKAYLNKSSVIPNQYSVRMYKENI